MDGAHWLSCRDAGEVSCRTEAENCCMAVSQCRATHRNVHHPHTQQEEADTKLILHAVEATASGSLIINIHSLDTDE